MHTFEECFNEAKKYEYKQDFLKNSPTFYRYSYRKGWIKNFEWLKLKTKGRYFWENFDNCFNEAKKYKTISEFRKNASEAYKVSKKMGWFSKYIWFKKKNTHERGYWTYERCYEEAKKYKYRGELQKENKTVYNISLKNNWLKNFVWLKNSNCPKLKKCKRHIWTYERCYEEAKKYYTKIDFIKNDNYLYQLVKKRGWLNDYKWIIDLKNEKAKIDSIYVYLFNTYKTAYIGRTLMCRQKERNWYHNNREKSPVKKFSIENNCSIPEPIYLEQNITIKEGLKKEDEWLNYYKSNGWNILNKAKTGVESGSLGGLKKSKWDKKKCFNEAKKYKTFTEFKKNCLYGYRVALKRGWVKDYIWMVYERMPNGYWTYERCYEEAKKYKTRSEFKRNTSGAYEVACRNKWLDDYTWIPKKAKNNKILSS